MHFYRASLLKHAANVYNPLNEYQYDTRGARIIIAGGRLLRTGPWRSRETDEVIQ